MTWFAAWPAELCKCEVTYYTICTDYVYFWRAMTCCKLFMVNATQVYTSQFSKTAYMHPHTMSKLLATCWLTHSLHGDSLGFASKKLYCISIFPVYCLLVATCTKPRTRKYDLPWRWLQLLVEWFIHVQRNICSWVARAQTQELPAMPIAAKQSMHGA